MSQKIIYTRISSKYDDYANWLTNNPILLEGEFAVAVDPNINDDEHPTILVKVGDGVHHYKDLPFISSNALDVPDWAKSNTKPVYTAEEIIGLDKYINTGSSSGGTTPSIKDTNTQYDIIKVDNYTYQFVAKNIGEIEYTKITTIDIPKYPSIESIQTLVTEEGSGIILTHTEDNKVNISIDKSILNDNGTELVTQEGSGIILTETEDNKVDISIDTSVVGGSGDGQKITASEDSGIVITQLENNTVDISLNNTLTFLFNCGTSADIK